MNLIIVIASAAVTAVVAFLIGKKQQKKMFETQIGSIEEQKKKLLAEAEKEKENLLKSADLDAKDLIAKQKAKFEESVKNRKREVIQQEQRVQSLEQRVLAKEEKLDRKFNSIEAKENELAKKNEILKTLEQNLSAQQKKAEETVEQARRTLETAAGMTADEAKRTLVEDIASDAKREAALALKKIEEELQENSVKKAQNILSIAIQRIAGEYSADRTVTVVSLPSEDMKGRIIGREGRNIRALEAATGIDLIIDDTPEAVVISCFDPVRREVAKRSLEKLIADGRIHPTRIEEIVQKTNQELDAEIKTAGEDAMLELGLNDIHVEILKLIGRLKFRTSYSQNQLQHSLECAYIASIMAAELKMDIKQAKRAALLHDIGKAMSHESEGGHAVIGGDFAKKYGESAEIVHAIRAHHEDERPSTPLAVITQASDSLSGARPGARREVFNSYIQRLEQLEKISTSFEGVDRCFALQAGREIRVMVSNDRINDADAVMLSRDIAKKIEQEVTYPGQIKITVLRETRAISYAK